MDNQLPSIIYWWPILPLVSLWLAFTNTFNLNRQAPLCHILLTTTIVITKTMSNSNKQIFFPFCLFVCSDLHLSDKQNIFLDFLKVIQIKYCIILLTLFDYWLVINWPMPIDAKLLLINHNWLPFWSLISRLFRPCKCTATFLFSKPLMFYGYALSSAQGCH